MNLDHAQHEADPWLPHLQTLHRTFYERANDRCLMWVNPAQSDPFSDDSLVAERRVVVPIQHPNFDVAFAPYIVPLDLGKSRDADVFKYSVAMAWHAWELKSLVAFNGQPIGGWIASDQSAPRLAQHWASNCHIHVINELTKLLRFHDPSPREWLWRTLTPLQKTQLLGPASFIVAFNRQQELMTHSTTRPLVSEGAVSVQDKLGKLQLTAAQWSQVDDYAVVHGAWLRWRSSLQSQHHVLETHDAWEQPVLHALRFASAYGISDKQDRELFASHALRIGADFHKHVRMRPVWEKTGVGEYYGAACEEVSGQPSDELLIYLQKI